MTLEQLIACCGSTRWANQMYARQPFADQESVHTAAEQIWWSLSEEDWLEAFSKHPKIGERSGGKWSAEEQSGMTQAGHDTAQAMASLNAAYYTKFGYIFIVCATGKSAVEMLEILQKRLNNSPRDEIRHAATEQAKIMHLRLDKL